MVHEYLVPYWYEFLSSPPWFHGKDIFIDVVSAIVVLAIGVFAFRNFLLDKSNKRQFILSSAFLLLALSFVAKIITNLIAESDNSISAWILGLVGPEIIETKAILPALGFLGYAAFTLFGFYVLYALTSKDLLSMNYVIIAYLIVVTIFFARFNYFILYLTALLFLAATTKRYIQAYWKTHNKNTLRLAWSFGIISLSHLVFIFTRTSPVLYVTAELIQLAGYLFLLYTFIMVLSNATKKK